MSLLWSLALVVAVLAGGGRAMPDPCAPGYHWNLTDVRRNAQYRLVDERAALCDNSLASGWYRMVSQHIGKPFSLHHIDRALCSRRIPNGCLKPYAQSLGASECGTLAPVWLRGKHPSPADDIVSRTVCANFGTAGRTDCCDHSLEIGVKNCGNFYVYYLKPVPACPVAYCAVSRTPCPAGQWSLTGYAPCFAAYPLIRSEPSLQGPFMNDHAFRFQCYIRHSDHDPNLRYEVQWLFDNQTDPNIPNQMLDGNHRTAVLPGTAIAGHLDHTLKCRVRAWYANQGFVHKSPWHESNSYYAGIKIDPPVVTVDQRTGFSKVTVTSTVPIVCSHNFRSSCCLSFMLDVDGPKNNIVLPHPCERKICTKDWNPATNSASVEIMLAAKKNEIQDGSRPMYLAFEKLQTAGGGAYLGVFNNYTLPPTLITMKHYGTRKCRWSGDPHITGFSGNYFHLYDAGDFTMYQNLKDNFEVQSRTVLCGRQASCQCGLVIREQNDVIRIDNCGQGRHAPVVETNHSPLREGTVIQRSRDGRTVMVYLPSGREVKVQTGGHYQNVDLTVPATDYGEGRGICGTIDDVDTNEYTHRNGTVEAQPCHRGRCIPADFEESWRNDPATSLFEHLPAHVPTKQEDPHYCQCDAGVVGSPRINCSVAADLAHMNRCPYCHTTSVLPFMTGAGWSTTKRHLANLYADMDEPDPPLHNVRTDRAFWNPTFPTPNGITEDQAHDVCHDEIQKAQLFGFCHEMTDLLWDHFANCVEDVLFADTFDIAEASVAAFTDGCQLKLINNVHNYDRDADGNLKLYANISEICSVSCLRNGQCVNGSCQCKDGFAGDNCQLVKDQPPRLLRIRGSNVCDINKRPCRKIYMDADHFEITDDFSCKVQEVLPNNTLATFYIKSPAEFIRGGRLACELPDAGVKHDRSVKMFNVSVTMNGTLYSNVLSVRTFDSTCQTCNISNCTIKNETCLIDNLCYEDGDIKMDNASLTCNSSVDPFNWTVLPLTYPNVTTPNLTGPSNSSKLFCIVNNSSTTTTTTATTATSTTPSQDKDPRFEVTWVLDGVVIAGLRHVITEYQSQIKIDARLLPKGTEIACRVRSFFDGHNDFSPYMTSNTQQLHV